jgi:transposase
MGEKSGGRPTKYRSEYCELLYERLSDGASLVEFCAEVGVSRETAYHWMRNHQPFSDAYTRAKEASEAFWTRKISQIMLEPSQNVTPPLVKLYMANRFGWSDQSEHKHTGDLTYRVVPADEDRIDADD